MGMQHLSLTLKSNNASLVWFVLRMTEDDWSATEPTLRRHVLHLDAELVSHEAHDAEYDESGEEAGQTVAARYDDGVPVKLYSLSFSKRRAGQCV